MLRATVRVISTTLVSQIRPVLIQRGCVQRHHAELTFLEAGGFGSRRYPSMLPAHPATVKDSLYIQRAVTDPDLTESNPGSEQRSRRRLSESVLDSENLEGIDSPFKVAFQPTQTALPPQDRPLIYSIDSGLADH